MPASCSIAFGIILWSVGGLIAMQTTQAPAVDLDHVILGVNNLERGVRQFESLTGVTPKRGGEHPGRGTQNALVTLGNGRYLEILAPAESKQTDASRDAWVKHAELTLVGWALHTRGIAGVVSQLRAAGFAIGDPMPGSRRTPDGALLQWQSATVTEPNLESVPFFIEWSQDTPHPSASAPAGCTFEELRLNHPAPARLRSFFNAAGFALTIARGTRPSMRLTLNCPRGRVVFETAAQD